MTAAPALPDLARGFEPLGTSDQGGRPDGMQLQWYAGHVFVGHVFSGGFSVIDARDPRAMRAVAFHPAPERTWNIHLQAADDLLQRLDRLLDRHLGVEAVRLVEVDVVGAQSLERPVDRLHDVLA